MAAPAAYGQAKDSPIAFAGSGGITTSFVTAPSVGDASAGYPGDNDQWLKVEFHYGATPALKTDWVDAIEFKVWIEGIDLLAKDALVPGKGVAVALTGSVTYVNVRVNKDIYGVVYVHPSSLARYCERSYTDFDRKFNVHVEAYVGGTKMDYFDKNREKDPNWFQPLRAVPGLVFQQNQTPFLLTDTTRYPALKLPGAAQ
jgi:hypothetical protein